MRARALLVCLLFLSAPIMTAGCGSKASGPRQFPVSGTVTFDGAPLPNGDIHFDGTEDGLGIDSARIENGNYSLQAKAGKKKVRIVASRKVEGKENAGIPGTPVYEDYIPEKFNTKSGLSAEIREGQENVFPFELQSK